MGPPGKEGNRATLHETPSDVTRDARRQTGRAGSPGKPGFGAAGSWAGGSCRDGAGVDVQPSREHTVDATRRESRDDSGVGAAPGQRLPWMSRA